MGSLTFPPHRSKAIVAGAGFWGGVVGGQARRFRASGRSQVLSGRYEVRLGLGPDLVFLEQNIPEIVDFNVLQKYWRKGIRTALMDEAERRIRRVSPKAGIGFGVFKDYGKAQILYVKRGYVPDGNGIVKDSKPVLMGEEVTVDQSVILFLVKELS